LGEPVLQCVEVDLGGYLDTDRRDTGVVLVFVLICVLVVLVVLVILMPMPMPGESARFDQLL
jgi:hypothetical protein